MTGNEPVEAVARHWAEAGAPHVTAVLHFGSTRTGATPGVASAHDLFVVVDDYAQFYRGLKERACSRRSPSTLAALNRVLPPNVLHGTSRAGNAKLFVLSERDLDRAVGPRASDHFVRARLAQDVVVVFARDPAAGERAARAPALARRAAVDWMRPFLRGLFSPSDFTRRMLEVSYASEIRPESSERVGEVFESQRPFLEGRYAEVLSRAEGDGVLRRNGERFEYSRAASATERWTARAWFAKSRARATLRWVKYVLTFDDWLGYVAAKVERRTGLRVELTPAERRWPLILLWPKFFRVMRARRATGRK